MCLTSTLTSTARTASSPQAGQSQGDHPAAPDRREDYRAKSEPEETGERLQDEKESRLSRWKSDMDRFADSMFSQAASTDE